MKFYSAGLMACLGSLLGAIPALGAEVILFQLQQAEVELSRQDFETMAETGAIPSDLESILGEDFQVPTAIQALLSRPIQLPSSVGKFLDSDTGEFLLRRMDALISSTSGQESENLTFLKSAFIGAVGNQQFSFLDLVRQYPQETVRINLTGLEEAYQDVAQFVEDMQSESSRTRQFLAKLLCNCPQASSGSFERSQTVLSTRRLAPCKPAEAPGAFNTAVQAMSPHKLP